MRNCELSIAIEELLDSADDEGCDGLSVVSSKKLNKLRGVFTRLTAVEQAEHSGIATTLSDGTQINYIGGQRVNVGAPGKGWYDLFGLDGAINRAIIPLIIEVNTLKPFKELVIELWSGDDVDWKDYIRHHHPSIAAVFDKEDKDESIPRTRKTKRSKSCG